jgi:hypothetical protein
VDSVSNDGQIVKLEDGSIWEVESGDAIDSMLWPPTPDIITCDDKLITQTTMKSFLRGGFDDLLKLEVMTGIKGMNNDVSKEREASLHQRGSNFI